MECSIVGYVERGLHYQTNSGEWVCRRITGYVGYVSEAKEENSISISDLTSSFTCIPVIDRLGGLEDSQGSLSW